MSRSVHAQAVIYDQLDFYQSGTFVRQIGVDINTLTLNLFVNGQILAWPLTDGSLIADANISAGQVYFNQISGNPGYYSIRFFPDRVGFWRVVVSRPNNEIIKEYDVTAAKGAIGGLNASFSNC